MRTWDFGPIGPEDKTDSPSDVTASILSAAFLAVLVLLAWGVWRFGGVIASIIGAIARGGWTGLPKTASSVAGSLFMAAVVIVAASGFYWLRENVGRLYATIELSVAALTAFHASRELGIHPNRTQWLFALLGAIYLGVRAYDNFAKARTATRTADAAVITPRPNSG